MLKVPVDARHNVLQMGLEQLVVSLGFAVAPREEADVALWDLLSAPSFPPPPPLPSLALIRTDERDALTVLRLGYRGYLFGHTSRPQLRKAVDATTRGEFWAERQLLGRAFSLPNVPTLTPREREVLALIKRGMSNKEIAQTLDLTENIVKGYVSKLLDKLKSRAKIISDLYLG